MPLFFTLDLCAGKELPPAYRKRLEEAAKKIRPAYMAYIGKIGALHKENLDWWFHPSIVRNIFTSSLFLRCCHIEAIRGILRDGGEIKEVTTDSPSFHQALREVFCKEIPPERIRCTFSLADRLKGIFSFGRRAAFSLFGIFRLLKAVRQFPLTKPIPDDAILLDLFFYPATFKNGIYNDRYYGNLVDSFRKETKKRVCYLGTLSYSSVRHDDVEEMLKSLREDERLFLFKEDLLTRSDYLWALLHPLRMRGLASSLPPFEGIDTRGMTKEDFFESACELSLYNGLLGFRFFKRLKEKGVTVSGYIDWFENQFADRGLNKGMRAFYPDAHHIGYIAGTRNPNYLCNFPLEEEFKAGIVPKVLAVNGNGMIPLVTEFAPSLGTCVIPAFRFSHLWKEIAPLQWPGNASGTKILVPLSFTVSDSVALLKQIVDVLALLPRNFPVSVRFKCHPVAPKEMLLARYEHALPANVSFIDGEFHALALGGDLVVANNSTTCVEAIALGIPVIVTGNAFGLANNPVPPSVPSEIWRFCVENEEIKDAIVAFSSRSGEEKERCVSIGEKIRSDFFFRDAGNLEEILFPARERLIPR